MNKLYPILALYLFAYSISFAQNPKELNRPKLVVGLVIDQMRPDYLYQFYNRYSATGFKRLMSKGHICENTFINYIPSYTAPGHACIYTGSVPALHGIVSNSWTDRQSGKNIYCTADDSVNNIGGTITAGKMSPKNMWANTITDELRLSSNFQSKVIAVSIKDRGAILPGGHTANAAYWMDDSNGVFMTSDFYMKKLPGWVKYFNEENNVKKYMAKNWNTLYPINTYMYASIDDNNYEGKFTGEIKTSFPHNLQDLKPTDIKKTPYSNDILYDFAIRAIENEQLGKNTYTDFISISFSATDYIGHVYGPNSVELEDCYLRMDKNIADLLQYLDNEIGEQNYTLFLTADHGVAHNAQYLLDQKVPAGFFLSNTIKTNINNHLKGIFNKDNLIKEVGETYIWLNETEIKNSNLTKEKVSIETIDFLQKQPEILFANDINLLHTSLMPTIIKESINASYQKSRCGDIVIILKPGWYESYGKTGTTHGTWNPYDTHIPMLWYGKGIQKGITHRKVHMTDIAPTIASLLHIQVPNACIGNTIEEVLEK